MAEVEVPEHALKPLESEEGLESAPVATEVPTGASEQDIEEEAAAFNREDAEELESALPDAPDEDEEQLPAEGEEPVGGEAAFSDQSGTFYIGRQFTLQGFANWFAVQGLGTLPYNGIGIHHTWRPVGSQYVGPKTVNAIFNYYATRHGWKRGKVRTCGSTAATIRTTTPAGCSSPSVRTRRTTGSASRAATIAGCTSRPSGTSTTSACRSHTCADTDSCSSC